MSIDFVPNLKLLSSHAKKMSWNVRWDLVRPGFLFEAGDERETFDKRVNFHGSHQIFKQIWLQNFGFKMPPLVAFCYLDLKNTLISLQVNSIYKSKGCYRETSFNRYWRIHRITEQFPNKLKVTWTSAYLWIGDRGPALTGGSKTRNFANLSRFWKMSKTSPHQDLFFFLHLLWSDPNNNILPGKLRL